jgi:hypothetical protein
MDKKTRLANAEFEIPAEAWQPLLEERLYRSPAQGRAAKYFEACIHSNLSDKQALVVRNLESSLVSGSVSDLQCSLKSLQGDRDSIHKVAIALKEDLQIANINILEHSFDFATGKGKITLQSGMSALVLSTDGIVRRCEVALDEPPSEVLAMMSWQIARQFGAKE